MPKRTDIHSVLIVGAGPIIIGQACEFDYSGTQACKALKEEGYRIVLVNSNPATIMTDPEFADRTYIEPITPEAVEKILVREKQEMKATGAKGELLHFKAGGLLSRAIQHEVDRLNGLLFIDRMTSADRKDLKPELDQLQEETKERLKKG